jgi:hypothetical protein
MLKTSGSSPHLNGMQDQRNRKAAVKAQADIIFYQLLISLSDFILNRLLLLDANCSEKLQEVCKIVII